ncbi:MAG: hypothetical protein ACPGVU_08345 [Limisphaerales bacterium]
MTEEEDKAVRDTGFRLILLYQVVLRPMGVVCLIAAIVYGLRGHWVIGVIFALIVFCLLRLWKWLQWMMITEAHVGVPEPEDEEEFPEEISPMPYEEAAILSKRLTVIGMILGVTTIALTVHHGLQWYFAIPAGIAATWLGVYVIGKGFLALSIWFEAEVMSKEEGR